MCGKLCHCGLERSTSQNTPVAVVSNVPRVATHQSQWSRTTHESQHTSHSSGLERSTSLRADGSIPSKTTWTSLRIEPDDEPTENVADKKDDRVFDDDFMGMRIEVLG